MAAVPPPVTFRLPAGWRQQAVGSAPGLDFVALHETSDAGFTANITVSLDLVTGDGAVEAMADGAVDRLAAAEQDVTVRRREELGHEPAPGLAQDVRLTTTVDGAPVELTQVQVFLPAADVDVEGRQAVYSLTFTATSRQAPELAPDFQTLVGSVRAVTDAPSGDAEGEEAGPRAGRAGGGTD